jgi:hypothetical protein
MPHDKNGFRLLRLGEILYLALTAISFYLLFISRSGEAHTVWQVLHPAFVPAFFSAASLLVAILLTSEKTAYKLICVIILSILLHSFFSVVFPAGDSSGQQMVLGRVRLVYDNAVLHGLTGWPSRNIQMAIYQLFMGANLQAALSVVLARMLSIDIFYVHLFFIPILWGTFTPIAAFHVTKAIGGNEKTSVLSSLLVSAFPYTIYFGAISVPNSLGFIFFFYSLYFMLKYLASEDSKTAYYMVVFAFFSLLSHYITGIMSLSLLLLATVFKTYRVEKKSSHILAGTSLVVVFLLCVSLLPLSFIYLRFVDPSASTAFTLNRFYESSTGELAGLFLFGSAISSDAETLFLLTIGPAIALLWMLYLLYRMRKSPVTKSRECVKFLFVAYLIVLIDYRILSMFMSGLPISGERLWVLRDFIAAPFVALAILTLVSAVKTKIHPIRAFASTRALSKTGILRALSIILIVNVAVPALLGGWLTFPLGVAYPRSGLLQTTWYELEAAKYIRDNTADNYVVIGDIWAVYAGEMIVGINNPRAYYFKELDAQGQRLFSNMLNETSPQTMIEAMNQTGTDTNIAYFIVTEPRLGAEVFNLAISKAKETLTVFHITGDGKLYVFSYRKEQE